MVTEYNRDIVISLLEKYHKNNGSISSRDALKNNFLPHPETVSKYFGSWNAAINESSIDNVNKREYTKNELIISLCEAEEQIVPLTSDKFDKHKNYPAKSTISNKFGSWSEACQIAGVESGQVTERSILKNIKELHKNGEIVNSEQFFNHSSTVSAATFYKYFNSWRDAVDKVDIAAFDEYRKSDIIKSLQEFYDEFGYISESRYKHSSYEPSSATIMARFGSWNNAVNAAGLETNSIGVAASQEPSGLKEELFGSNYQQMRERCSERDDFACRNCESEKNLHCHHDKRRVEYRNSEVFEIEESNKLENLITLCKSCHNEAHSAGISVSNDISQLQPRIV